MKAQYRAFKCARARCTNPKNPAYPDYGGRGIEFLFTLEEWLARIIREDIASAQLLVRSGL